MSSCMLNAHKDNNNTIQVYSVTVRTHVIALDAGQSNHETFESVTRMLTVCIRQSVAMVTSVIVSVLST